MSDKLRAVARSIFNAALDAVNVREAVRRRISLGVGRLELSGRSVPLADIDRVLLICMGKAAVPMFDAAIGVLGAAVPCDAVVVAPAETLPDDPANFMLPGAHPTPTVDSLQAADAVLRLLSSATERSVVLFLISGGASAMVERPLDPAITLEDLAAFHRALVGSGMSITEMNALRKHLSAVKGGRLAKVAGAALLQCTLLISDVPSSAPDAVASGPSLPDSTTVEQCRHLFERLDANSRLPQRVRDFFLDPKLPETPRSDDAAFARAGWEVILSADHLAAAAEQAARAAGFHTEIDNTPDDWEYRDAGRHLLDRSASLAKQHARTCVISVGEVGVNTGGEHGEGGRNGQFALWCARELHAASASTTVLSAGSDGIDGHSTAAGAVCDETSVLRARAKGLSVEDALAHFNTAPLLHSIGDNIDTGPTGNNLRDLRLILTER